MPSLLTFLVRLLLVIAGLVVTAGVAVVGAVVATLWLARSLVGKLTGKPSQSFLFRMRRGVFGAAFRPGSGDARPAPASASPSSMKPRNLRGEPDITDVEPRQP